MKQNLLVICEAAILDQITGNLSLINIFDKFIAKNTPIFTNFAVVTRFEGGSEGEHIHKIIIRGGDGNEIAKLEGKINFNQNGRAQYVGRFIGLPLNRLGEYKIESYVDGDPQPIVGLINVVKE